jgi:hypothetical protein
MTLDSRALALIKQRLDEAERNIQYARQAIENGEVGATGVVGEEMKFEDTPIEGERVVEGVFDGQNMQGNDGAEYPMPPNYASKSKLVEGDVLKLTVGADGSFLYKQISPVERRRVVGRLEVDEQGNFMVATDEKNYKVLLASVTFYKAEEGDQTTVLVPENGDAEWGAVEHVLHNAAVPG